MGASPADLLRSGRPLRSPNPPHLLRPALLGLEKLVERLRDTACALGSDLMDASVEGYALLKITGRNQGLDGLVKELCGCFARSARKPGGEA